MLFRSYQAAIGTPQQWDAEAELRGALRSRRLRILTQFNAIPQGVKFLVDLRADLLRFIADDPLLKPLDRELETRLSAWFDVGFLELQRITWSSPAALLEKLVEYEAVHEIRSWKDLKNRLDSDRRCYAFFHPRMPLEPLIFVQVALLEEIADDVQRLLDIEAPLADAGRATTAIFYSISATQKGLRGVSFGNFLLKRVIDDLKRDFPRLKTFATLSPMPGLVRWAQRDPEAFAEAFNATDWKRLDALGIEGGDSPRLAALLRQSVLHVGADSGVTHLAMALGLPTVTAYREYDGRLEWTPTGPRHRQLLVDCACIRQPQASCVTASRAECLGRIRPEAMLEACLALVDSPAEARR